MAVFPEVKILLNYHVEWTVILNDITQDNTKVLGDERNKTLKLNRMERSTEEAVSPFKSVVEAEQRNGGPKKKVSLEENETPAKRFKPKSNKRRMLLP